MLHTHTSYSSQYTPERTRSAVPCGMLPESETDDASDRPRYGMYARLFSFLWSLVICSIDCF